MTKHLLPFFGEHLLRQITVAEVDRYRVEKLAEGTLSGDSVNKTLVLLGRILDVALERELIDKNPMRVNPRNRKAKAAARTVVFLDTAEQIAAMLDAAADLDGKREARTARRRALVATLVLGGLRVGELCALEWRDVDLATGRILVGRAKTEAGVREVRVLPALRDELVSHKLAAVTSGPRDLVFPTARGTARDKDTFASGCCVPLSSGRMSCLRSGSSRRCPRTSRRTSCATRSRPCSPRWARIRRTSCPS
ncbi:MAG: tyrosine-type recombinase/integrase [Actinomycetota bacterium]|nr:tyrosine-type recombinase/integrase [Actinomycetota bacterium]